MGSANSIGSKHQKRSWRLTRATSTDLTDIMKLISNPDPFISRGALRKAFAWGKESPLLLETDAILAVGAGRTKTKEMDPDADTKWWPDGLLLESVLYAGLLARLGQKTDIGIWTELLSTLVKCDLLQRPVWRSRSELLRVGAGSFSGYEPVLRRFLALSLDAPDQEQTRDQAVIIMGELDCVLSDFLAFLRVHHPELPNVNSETLEAALHQTKLELERQDSKSAHWRSLYDEFKEEGEDQDQINHYASLINDTARNKRKTAGEARLLEALKEVYDLEGSEVSEAETGNDYSGRMAN